MNINGLNNSYTTTNNGLVSNAELQQVSQELFAAAKVNSNKVDFSNLNFSQLKTQTDNNSLNIFAKGTDIQTANQVAMNKAGLDVQLSQNALSSIQMLRVEAAKSQAITPQTNEGKAFLTPQASGIGDAKEVFALNNAPQLFNTSELSKDRKGSNPFAFVSIQPEQENEEQDINIFA